MCTSYEITPDPTGGYMCHGIYSSQKTFGADLFGPSWSLWRVGEDLYWRGTPLWDGDFCLVWPYTFLPTLPTSPLKITLCLSRNKGFDELGFVFIEMKISEVRVETTPLQSVRVWTYDSRDVFYFYESYRRKEKSKRDYGFLITGERISIRVRLDSDKNRLRTENKVLL